MRKNSDDLPGISTLLESDWYYYALDLDWLNEINQTEMPIEKYENFLELSVKQLVKQSIVIQSREKPNNMVASRKFS